MQERELLPIIDVSRVLGDIGRSTVYKLIDAGELERVHVGRRALVTRRSLHDYIERLAGRAHAGGR